MKRIFTPKPVPATPLRAVAGAAIRAARWSRFAAHALGAHLLALLAARCLGLMELVPVAIALSIGAVLSQLAAMGAHGSAYVDSRRALRQVRGYAATRVHHRVLHGLWLSALAQMLMGAAVFAAGLAWVRPLWWLLALAGLLGVWAIARYCHRTGQVFAVIRAESAGPRTTLAA